MQNSETTLWVSSEGGFVYSMPYPLTPSTVPADYEQICGAIKRNRRQPLALAWSGLKSALPAPRSHPA